MLILIPTDELFAELNPSESLLQSANVSLKQLAETVIARWVQMQSEWAFAYSTFDDRSCRDVIVSEICFDWLQEPGYRCMEASDRQAVEQLVRYFTGRFYTLMTTMLEGLNYQTEHYGYAKFDRWVDNNPVIDLPTDSRARHV